MSRGVSDKITYKPYNQGEQWLLPPSLEELVPQNHFVRIVSKTVDELEIEEVFARNTKGGGASRYNPIMLLKVLIYCYMTGIYSCHVAVNQYFKQHDRIVSACSATFCVSCKYFFNFKFIYCFADNSYKMILRNQLFKAWWQEPLLALVIWFVCDFIAYASAHI